jgi:glutamate-1-semialdehyde 2,1-aminomutase
LFVGSANEFRTRVKMTKIDRARIKKLVVREEENFIEQNPKSKKLFERAKASLLAGVPMNWMVRWAGTFPVFVKEAKNAYVVDVDGHRYVDFCLGDTGAMFGHSPKPVVDAVINQVRHGITTMLPTEDSIWVAAEMARRFGLPYWQVAMTATDANRFAIRLAREVTKRKKILVFNGCYHGSVDETLVDLKRGRAVLRRGNIGPPVDLQITTKVIEFNDLEALEKALSPQDVASVICEPAMTNRGIILPEPGYHETLRMLTRRYGTLLIIDETHTICCGPGGYTAAHNLKPDIVTMGKPIGSGIPSAAYGISQEVADKIIAKVKADTTDESGIGGTLSGNALAVAAIKATLKHVITKEAFDRMVPLAERFVHGIDRTIKAENLPWHVVRLGVRVEYRFRSTPPKNGEEAEATKDPELDRLMHLYALNRGILLTPFHNMALISPYHSAGDVDFHTKVFQECIVELTK